MKHLLYIFLTSLLAASCTLEQQVHFNSDWSGNSKMIINSSLMKEFEMDSTSAQDSSMIKTSQDLDEIDGVTNVELYDDKNGDMVVSYDFRDIRVLNASMHTSESAPSVDEEYDYFELRGNTIIYKMPPLGVDSTEIAAFKLMSDMIKYKLTLTFDKKIKKLKATNGATIGDDKKSVIWEPTILSLVNGDIDPTIEVTLK
jgi:uncharacterized protein YcfL